MNNTRGGGACTSIPPPQDEDRRGPLEVEDEVPSCIDNLSRHLSMTCSFYLTLTGGADGNRGSSDSLGPGESDLATSSSLRAPFWCHDARGACKISSHQQFISVSEDQVYKALWSSGTGSRFVGSGYEFSSWDSYFQSYVCLVWFICPFC